MGNGCRGNGHFIALKRLSNEFDDMIGADPATRLSLAAGAGAAAGVSETEGFNGGRLDACLVSAFGAMAFGMAASGRAGVSVRLASITLVFAGGGGLPGASAVPPIPTLRARLLKNPSDSAFGAALATRV